MVPESAILVFKVPINPDVPAENDKLNVKVVTPSRA